MHKCKTSKTTPPARERTVIGTCYTKYKMEIMNVG